MPDKFFSIVEICEVLLLRQIYPKFLEMCETNVHLLNMQADIFNYFVDLTFLRMILKKSLDL